MTLSTKRFFYGDQPPPPINYVPQYLNEAKDPQPPPTNDAPQHPELGNKANKAKKRASETILSTPKARLALFEAINTGDKDRIAQARANFKKAEELLRESQPPPEKMIKPAETTLIERLSDLNNFLKGRNVKIHFDLHKQGSVNVGFSSSSKPHASYKVGEDRNQRVQDYLSIGLKKFLDKEGAVYSAKIKEIQMSAFGLKDGKYSNLIISGNNDRDNKKITDAACSFIRKQESDIASHNGVRVFNDFNLLGFSKLIAETVKPKTEKTKVNADLTRRMDKLAARSSEIFGQSVTLYIPKANKHAEQVVLDFLKLLKVADDDRLQISGSKLPCVGCASELYKQGVPVQYTTGIFNSAIPKNEELFNLIKGGINFGKISRRDSQSDCELPTLNSPVLNRPGNRGGGLV